jgi:hypothetical protein
MAIPVALIVASVVGKALVLGWASKAWHDRAVPRIRAAISGIMSHNVDIADSDVSPYQSATVTFGGAAIIAAGDLDFVVMAQVDEHDEINLTAFWHEADKIMSLDIPVAWNPYLHMSISIALLEKESCEKRFP